MSDCEYCDRPEDVPYCAQCGRGRTGKPKPATLRAVAAIGGWLVTLAAAALLHGTSANAAGGSSGAAAPVEDTPTSSATSSASNEPGAGAHGAPAPSDGPKPVRSEASGVAAPVVRGTRSSVTIGELTGSYGLNAAREVAMMRAGFRACYNRGLAEDPAIGGHFQLRVSFKRGKLDRVSVSSKQGLLPKSVVDCIEARVRSSSIDPPKGGQGTLEVPLSLHSG